MKLIENKPCGGRVLRAWGSAPQKEKSGGFWAVAPSVHIQHNHFNISLYNNLISFQSLNILLSYIFYSIIIYFNTIKHNKNIY